MDDDLKAILVAAGLLGLGIAGVSMLSSKEKRSRFRDALRNALGEHDISLVSAELGRKQTGEPVWVLTIDHPVRGVISFRAAFSQGADPYSEATFTDLFHRLMNAEYQ